MSNIHGRVLKSADKERNPSSMAQELMEGRLQKSVRGMTVLKFCEKHAHLTVMAIFIGPEHRAVRIINSSLRTSCIMFYVQTYWKVSSKWRVMQSDQNPTDLTAVFSSFIYNALNLH